VLGVTNPLVPSGNRVIFSVICKMQITLKIPI
jgi:hypothetical protein